MRWRRLVAGLLIALPAPLAAERLDGPPPGLIGLVSPPLVPDGPPGCLRMDSRQTLPLHAGPDAGQARIGTLEFRPWREHSRECDEATPYFVPAGTRASAPVPTLERGYEEPALILLEQRGHWLRIDLGQSSGWLRQPSGYTVEAYPALLTDKLAYATTAWSGETCETAGAACSNGPRLPEQPLRVLSQMEKDGTTWLEVELTTDGCRDGDARVIRRGWLRARDARGRPTVWFHSRGY